MSRVPHQKHGEVCEMITQTDVATADCAIECAPGGRPPTAARPSKVPEHAACGTSVTHLCWYYTVYMILCHSTLVKQSCILYLIIYVDLHEKTSTTRSVNTNRVCVVYFYIRQQSYFDKTADKLFP